MKKIRKVIQWTALLSLCLLSETAVHAQFGCMSNLVPNPSFEYYTSCPTGISQTDLAFPWFQPTAGTSDYYNACANISASQVGVPDNWVGNLNAHTGEAYTGGYMFTPEGYHEYIEAPLLSPLAAGHTYSVSFYVALSSSPDFNNAIDNIGACLSVGSLSAYVNTYLPNTPQVRSTPGTLLTSPNWTLIQGSFTTLTGGESYITIGNFDDGTDTEVQNGGGIQNSYYFIDDVSVVDAGACTNSCTDGCLIITNPDDITVTTCSNSALVSFAAEVTDTCCPGCATVSYNWPSGSNFPVGTTTVTTTATDALGHSNSCTFKVTVVQVTNPPVITSYPPNVIITVDNAVCGQMLDETYQVAASVSIGSSYTVTQDIAPGTDICTDTTMTFTVSDVCGDSTNVTVPVTLEYIIPCDLQIQGCADIVTNSCTNVQIFYPLTASDACCSNVASITCVPASGSYFAPGSSTTVSCTVTDNCGGSNSCSFQVTVYRPGLQITCPTNKTTNCGSAWNFDTPMATTCCPDGIVHVVSLGAATNGTCPKIATNSWVIYDDCGNTNYCGQSVTLLDTTAPVINCPTNPIIGLLNSNCELVIPTISLTATDNCTPPCSLVYTQYPTNGTIISGSTATVTVTVSDLCSNSSQCQVTVTGQPKNGPVLNVPKTIMATNCTVPCVPVYSVGVSCCTSLPHLSQSPACGAALTPGLNYITVTATDCHGKSTSVNVRLTGGSAISFLPALTNTGISASGTLLVDGTVDTHYALPSTAVPSGMPSDYHDNAVAVSDICHGTPPSICNFVDLTGNSCWHWVPWGLAPDPATTTNTVSKWIAPDYTNNGCSPSGSNANYTYSMNFQFPSSLDPTSAWISGRIAADNSATIYLNGTNDAHLVGGGGSPSTWTGFTIGPGNLIKTGNNTLYFVVNNQSHWTGLRVEFTNAVAGCATCSGPNINWMNGAGATERLSSPQLSVDASGTPPLSYQWSYNGNEIAGATNPVLALGSMDYSNAGTYTVTVNNSCGTASASSGMTVVAALPWTNGIWNVTSLTNPLAATYGQSLILTNAFEGEVNSGTTVDFGLPNPGGQVANVLDIAGGNAASIQLPPIIPEGSNEVDSYTVIMDVYVPDTSVGNSGTLFSTPYVTNLSSGGQDGLSLTLDASNYVHVTGTAAGVAFDNQSVSPLPVDAWTRVALVLDSSSIVGVSLASPYIDGAIAYPFSCPCCMPIPINTGSLKWTNGSPVVVTPQTNASAATMEIFVTGLQFHAMAMTPQMMAAMGSPDNGPVPTSTVLPTTAPTLSATMSTNGITISWSGSGYALQETTDLNSGEWTVSSAPFTESESGGDITTTAKPQPIPQGPSKFYRLVFSP